MSLDWNIGQVRDYKELSSNDLEIAKTNYLVWASLCIDLSKITESNVQEWYSRIQMWELVCEGPIYNMPLFDGNPYRLTKQDIARRVGLYTNVDSKTRAGFMKKVVDHLNSKYPEGKT